MRVANEGENARVPFTGTLRESWSDSRVESTLQYPSIPKT